MSDRLCLTVLGTADLHGHVLNWDYFADREFDHAGEKVGLASVGTLVRGIKAERDRSAEQADGSGDGRAPVLLVDAGDTIGGTPLAYYHARVEPITEQRIHPLAAAMNSLGYDAAVPGNHDFDYGLPLLRDWERQLSFPLLAANVVTRTGQQAFRPYVIRSVPGDEHGPVRVGILGLGNPGTEVWDRCRLSGELIFSGLVEQARFWVPRIRREGADLVLVLAHAGTSGRSTYADRENGASENAAAQIAADVPGVDAILAGHAHDEIDELVVLNRRSGCPVVITEPAVAGCRLSVIEIELARDAVDPGRWHVADRGSHLLKANEVEQDPEIVRLTSSGHDEVVRYLNTRIGTCPTELRLADTTWRSSAAVDLVNHVQAATVRRGVRGTEHDRLPVLALTSLCNKKTPIPAGGVAIRHLVALYPFDNLLLAVRLTGAQLRDYLERAATYFRQVGGSRPYRSSELIRAPTRSHPEGAPDYSYDVLGGLDAPVAYDIDVSARPGHRIRGLSYADRPIADGAEFVVAVNDYRQSGAGLYPHIAAAPVIYDRRQEIRQLVIDWVRARGRIDLSEFTGNSGAAWRLVAGNEPVRILDTPE